MPRANKLSHREIREVQLELLDTLTSICEAHNLRLYLTGGTLLGAVRHKGFIPWDDDIDLAMLRPDYEYLIKHCRAEFPADHLLTHHSFDPITRFNAVKLEHARTYLRFDKDMYYERDVGVFIDIFPLDIAPSNSYFFDIHRSAVSAGKFMFRRTLAIEKPRVFWREWAIRATKALIGGEKRGPYRQNLERFVQAFSARETGWLANYHGMYKARERFPAEWVGPGPTKLTFEGREHLVFDEYDKYLTHIYGDYMTPPSEAQKNDDRHFVNAYWTE